MASNLPAPSRRKAKTHPHQTLIDASAVSSRSKMVERILLSEKNPREDILEFIFASRFSV
jgi:hypothetical protein